MEAVEAWRSSLEDEAAFAVDAESAGQVWVATAH
jgi:hypothetical protein